MRTYLALLSLAFVSFASWLTVAAPLAAQQFPGTPTAAPSPTAVPSPTVQLARPFDLTVDRYTVRFSDQSTGEDGYRVVATIGSVMRSFDLPPDATVLDFPADFRALASCQSPLGNIVMVEVFAFKGAQTGEVARATSTGLCAPGDSPATATTTAPPVLRAPNAGDGSTTDTGGERPVRVLAAVLAAGVAFMAAGGYRWFIGGRRAE